MQTALDFPQPLVERYRPSRLDQFIGIPQAKRIASEIISRPSPGRAYLFAGESGTGKDCMKLAIARALNAEFHYMPARQVSKEEIERVWELCHYSTWTGSNWRVVGLPEADLMRIDLQQMFLSLLDGTGSLTGGLFGDYQPHPPQVLWLFSTNCDPSILWTDSRFEPRFLSRVRIVPFSNYGIQRELAAWLEDIWHKEGGNGDGPNFARIAKERKGNVRACLQEIESEIAKRQYATA